MIRRILITSTILTALTAQASVLAFAQTRNVTVVREAIPQQQTAIVANSPQDLALQEEIRKIRASNAAVESQVGISDSYTTAAPAFTVPASSNTYVAPVTNQYQGKTIELYDAPKTQITYASTIPQQTAVVPTTTIIERRPVAGYTRIHRVVADDTLYRLAKSNCVSVADIQDQNAMSDTNIRIGQVLALPASKCGATAQTTSATSVSRSEIGVVRRVMPIQTGIKVHSGNAYAVLPKDSLYSIGKRYCVSAGELAGYNGINTKTAIQPGQILRLPRKACHK